MSEAVAVPLDRTLRFRTRDRAKGGPAAAEMEQRFGYSLQELARWFDHSVTWVSRRLALIELLPEAIQQQVREGKIAAHVAMKLLVPVARQNIEGCQGMAAIFAELHCDTREAGQRYAARRRESAAIRKRILEGVLRPCPHPLSHSECNVPPARSRTRWPAITMRSPPMRARQRIRPAPTDTRFLQQT